MISGYTNLPRARHQKNCMDDVDQDQDKHQVLQNGKYQKKCDGCSNKILNCVLSNSEKIPCNDEIRDMHARTHIPHVRIIILQKIIRVILKWRHTKTIFKNKPLTKVLSPLYHTIPWLPRMSSHGIPSKSHFWSTLRYASHSDLNCCDLRPSANLAWVRSPETITRDGFTVLMTSWQNDSREWEIEKLSTKLKWTSVIWGKQN